MASKELGILAILASFIALIFMMETIHKQSNPSKNADLLDPIPTPPPQQLPQTTARSARTVSKHKKWSITKSTKGPARPGQLIFFEDFDKLDLDLWQPVITMSGCGTGEFQMYNKHEENLYVQDSVLHIVPSLTSDFYGENFLYNGTLLLENCTDSQNNGCNKTAADGYILNPIISARIRTLGSFSFKYGTVEVKAKMPRGDWIWPAIWMNPRDKAYGEWPMSGEIDILESRGNRLLFDPNNVNVGNEQVQSTVHFGNMRSDDQWRLAHVTQNSDVGYDQQFHRYQFQWTPDSMTFGVDDQVTMIIRPPSGGFYEFGNFTGENIWINASNPVMAPFDQQFYFILNVAVGGTMGYFSDANTNCPFPKPWKNGEPMDDAMLEFWKLKENWLPTWSQGLESALRIDYVKVWAL